jgi:cysteine synthase
MCRVQVMAGQGTVAVELLQQLPQGIDAIIVPVGGGGLIGGIAAVMKAWRPEVQVRRGQDAGSKALFGGQLLQSVDPLLQPIAHIVLELYQPAGWQP